MVDKAMKKSKRRPMEQEVSPRYKCQEERERSKKACNLG